MNDFLRVEVYSKEEAYLILIHPQENGSIEEGRLKVPFETLQDMVTENWVNESLRENVGLAESGVFSVKW